MMIWGRACCPAGTENCSARKQTAEETDGGSESVENSDNDRTTGGRCSYQNKEENTEDSSINTIPTWLDELHDLRKKIKCRKTESIIMSCADPEDLQEADVQLKQKIKAARGMTL